MLDLQGEGVNFDNLWSGPDMPFGGSLIMMTLDIFLYGYLAYYLDSVLPSACLNIFEISCLDIEFVFVFNIYEYLFSYLNINNFLSFERIYLRT